MADVKFFFDYISPYAYLASTQLHRLNLNINYFPISVLEVMDIVNNQPSPSCPSKLRYAFIDTQRWARRYKVPLQANAAWWEALESGEFDMRTLVKGALASQEMDCFEKYNQAIWSAIWGGVNSDILSREGREKLLNDANLDGAAIWGHSEDQAICKLLDSQNRQAARMGVFGVPIFDVEGELFFGNDRLDFVVEAVNFVNGQVK